MLLIPLNGFKLKIIIFFLMNFSYKNIDIAHSQIKNQIIQTPLISNDYINKKLNSKVFFKLENLQNTGSFKLRGATYKFNIS